MLFKHHVISQHVASKPWGRSAFDPSPVAAQERVPFEVCKREKRVASTTRGHVIMIIMSWVHWCALRTFNIINIRCRIYKIHQDTNTLIIRDHPPGPQKSFSRTRSLVFEPCLERELRFCWWCVCLCFYIFEKVLLGVEQVFCCSWFMIHYIHFFVLIHVLFVEGVRMEVKIGRDGGHTLQAETGTLTFDTTWKAGSDRFFACSQELYIGERAALGHLPQSRHWFRKAVHAHWIILNRCQRGWVQIDLRQKDGRKTKAARWRLR